MNTKTETPVTREQIIADYNRVIKEMNERREYRAQNYYNCIDDYSYGSPYHTAADSLTEGEARKRMELRLEMLEKGYCELLSHCDVLLDSNGNIVAEEARSGKYGYYFKTEDGFVGLPNKISTLEKKGYSLRVRERKFKAKFINKFSQKGNPIFDEIVMESEDLLMPFLSNDRIQQINHPSFIEWLYFQKNS